MIIFYSLKDFREHFGLTLEKVGEILGISKQSVGSFEKNNKLPKKRKEILEKEYNCKFEFAKKSNSENRYVNIPVLGEVSASMGYGITIYNENQTGCYEISRKLLNDLGLLAEKTEMILASGDSMLPTIEGGDSLLVDLNRKEIYDGRIYCVRIDGQLYAKRLQKIPPSKVIVISDNTKYKSFEIDFSKEINFDFEVIGEIRWWGRVAR